MNFWEFLDKDGIGFLLFGTIFVLIVSFMIGLIIDIIHTHRETMATLQPGPGLSPGDRLVRRGNDFVVVREQPEKEPEMPELKKFRGYSNSGMPL